MARRARRHLSTPKINGRRIATQPRAVDGYFVYPTNLTRPEEVKTLKTHLLLLGYSFLTWLSFYLIGLPDYYQQWPPLAKLAILPLVTALYFPFTHWALRKFWTDGRHFINSCWLAFYLTLPLFIYDYLLLALYKDLGIGFVIPYWYLTFFYFSFWIQFPAIGWLLQRSEKN